MKLIGIQSKLSSTSHLFGTTPEKGVYYYIVTKLIDTTEVPDYVDDGWEIRYTRNKLSIVYREHFLYEKTLTIMYNMMNHLKNL